MVVFVSGKVWDVVLGCVSVRVTVGTRVMVKVRLGLGLLYCFGWGYRQAYYKGYG